MSAGEEPTKFKSTKITKGTYLVLLGKEWIIYKPDGKPTCNDCVKHPTYCNEGWEGCEKYYPKEELSWLMRILSRS